MKHNIISIVVLILAVACKSSSDQMITLKLDDHLSSDVKDVSFNDLFEVIGMSQLSVSDSTMLSRCLVASMTEDKIIWWDPSKILVSDRNGNVANVISRKGRGPGEYSSLVDVKYDERADYIYICDYAGPLKIYKPSGSFVGNVDTGGSVSSFCVDDSYLYFVDKSDSACFTVASAGVKPEIIRKSSMKKRQMKTAMITLDGLEKYGPDVYFRRALSDTLYVITPESEEAFLHLDCGSHKMPLEYYATLDLMDSHSDDYITNFGVDLIKDKAFVSFVYKQKAYYDLWDIQHSKLLHRHIATMEDPTFGLPFNIDGTTCYLWPKYVSDREMLCELNPSDAASLFPDYDEMTSNFCYVLLSINQ